MASKRKRFGVQELLQDKASFNGWLKKYSEKKFSKGYANRYCVLHKGYLYYFNDFNSRSQSENLSLAGYKALAKEDKKYKWGILLENSGVLKSRSYHLAVSSQREQEEWIKHVNEEIQLKRVAGDGDSEEEYDDVKKEFPPEYDYAKRKPDDVTFFDPEQSEKLINKNPFSKADTFLVSNFHGPKLTINANLVSPSSPSVPPRPRFTLPEYKPSLSPKQKQTSQDDIQFSEDKSSKEEDYTSMHACVASEYDDVQNHYLKLKGSDNEAVSDVDDEDDYTADYINVLNKDEQDDYTYDYLNPQIDVSPENLLPQSVYQWKLSREQADLSLKRFNRKGAYLIRENREKRHVLSIYDGQASRHYIIYKKKDLLFLSRDPEPKFKSLIELVRHYRHHHLPTCDMKLLIAYK